MCNMNDIYARLANGEKIEDIGNEITAMMNEAVAKHEADLRAAEEAKKVAEAEADKAKAKRELIEKLVKIIQELAVLEGMDPDELKVSEDDLNQLTAAFTEMFSTMRDLKKMVVDLETHIGNTPKSDEQILADFLKMFNECDEKDACLFCS